MLMDIAYFVSQTMATHLPEIVQTVVDQSPRETWPILVGVAAFGSTLAISTLAQWRILGISTGSLRPLPTAAGFATVCVASLASHHASIAAHEYVQYGRKPASYFDPARFFQFGGSNWNNAAFSYREDYLDLKYFKIPLHTIRICTVGLIAFKLFGGRFWAISPSSYTNLGSFARPNLGIPATDRYATNAQRAAVERIGRATGCHTCGSRRLFTLTRGTGTTDNVVKFVGDHMPPKAVAQQLNQQWHRKWLGRTVSFRFFPQCVPCSSKQGGILAKASAQAFTQRINLSGAGGGSQAYFHGLRPRPNHLAGGAIAALAVVGAAEEDIMDGNRWRYASLHRQVDARIQRGWKDIRKVWSR